MPDTLPAATLDRLFEPVTIAGCTLPNRIVMAPMTRQKAPEGIVTEDILAYYRRRAAGGTGLIITEGTPVSVQASPSTAIPGFFGEEALESWRPVVEAVHAEGGRIMPQLWHVGLMRGGQRMAFDDTVPSVGPSGFYPRLVDGRPEEPPLVVGQTMTQADIDRTIDDFATAAAHARRLGFDGVELHGAHGYLFDQFFWQWSNRRTDRYGGAEIAARTRFAAETIAEVRRRVGPGFPIGFRFSQWKLPANYGEKMLRTPSELEAFLAPLVAAGVDFFDCSTRRYNEPEFAGSALNLAGWTRKLTGVVAMTVGSVGLDGPLMVDSTGLGEAGAASIAPLLERLARGEFDLVGIGRASIANPAWPMLLREGRSDELKPYDAAALDVLY